MISPAVNNIKQSNSHGRHRRCRRRQTRSQIGEYPNCEVVCFPEVPVDDDPAQLSISGVRNLRALATSGAYSVPLEFKMDIVVHEPNGTNDHGENSVPSQRHKHPSSSLSSVTSTDSQSSSKTVQPITPRAYKRRERLGYTSPFFSLPKQSYILDATESPTCPQDFTSADTLDYDCDTDDEIWLERYNKSKRRCYAKRKCTELCIDDLELALSYTLSGRCDEVRDFTFMADHASAVLSYAERKMSKTSHNYLIPRKTFSTDDDSAYTCFRPYNDYSEEPMAVYKRRRRPRDTRLQQICKMTDLKQKVAESSFHNSNIPVQYHVVNHHVAITANERNHRCTEGFHDALILPRNTGKLNGKMVTSAKQDSDNVNSLGARETKGTTKKIASCQYVSSPSPTTSPVGVQPPMSCVGNRTRRRKPLSVLNGISKNALSFR